MTTSVLGSSWALFRWSTMDLTDSMVPFLAAGMQGLAQGISHVMRTGQPVRIAYDGGVDARVHGGVEVH